MIFERYKIFLWVGYGVIFLFVLGYLGYLLLVKGWETPDVKISDLLLKPKAAPIPYDRKQSEERRKEVIDTLKRKHKKPEKSLVLPTRNLETYRKHTTNELIAALEQTRSTFEKRDILAVLSERKDTSIIAPLTDKLKKARYRACRDEIVIALLKTGSEETRKNLWDMGYINEDGTLVEKSDMNKVAIPSKVTAPAKNTLTPDEIKKIFGDVTASRGTPEATIKRLLDVLRSGKANLYEKASVALRMLSRKNDFPIVSSSTAQTKAARIADDWEAKLLEGSKQK